MTMLDCSELFFLDAKFFFFTVEGTRAKLPLCIIFKMLNNVLLVLLGKLQAL